MSCHF